MRLLLVAIVFFSVAVSGCSTPSVKTYTFKKDRVDQRIEGNRGYVLGTPPPAPVEREVPKRTLFGVDIEIPILPGEKVELPPQSSSTVVEEPVLDYTEAKVETDQVVEKRAVPAKPTVVVHPEKVEPVETEKDWVK
ncbi:MAG: hypothetical protein ABID09_05220 [Candidatus Omnitrophota bacterium]